MKFLQNLFNPTVNSLTASLQSTVERLEALAVKLNARRDAHEANAHALLDKADACYAEAAAARRVADRIGKLFA